MQYNIYFRKDNWERFKTEPDKSALVNELLATHYGIKGTVGKVKAVRVEKSKRASGLVMEPKEQGTPEKIAPKPTTVEPQGWVPKQNQAPVGAPFAFGTPPPSAPVPPPAPKKKILRDSWGNPVRNPNARPTL